jgi:hypothetical protein
MQLVKSISIITISTILSFSVISSYANETEINNEQTSPIEKQSIDTSAVCDEYPLCDVDKTSQDDEWPQVSVDSQR